MSFWKSNMKGIIGIFTENPINKKNHKRISLVSKKYEFKKISIFEVPLFK